MRSVHLAEIEWKIQVQQSPVMAAAGNQQALHVETSKGVYPDITFHLSLQTFQADF